MTTTITVCDTCKKPGWDAETSEKTDGTKLAELVEQAANGAPGVRVRRHSCMMGCKRACNIAIQSNDKLCYVLGQFDTTDEDANGIVEYAKLHAASETGQVPFREWPVAIKGHFVARLPLLPSTTDDDASA